MSDSLAGSERRNSLNFLLLTMQLELQGARLGGGQLDRDALNRMDSLVRRAQDILAFDAPAPTQSGCPLSHADCPLSGS